MDHGDVRYSQSLPSTYEEIIAECPRFRILVLGKTGCGKSSLINKVFKVDLAQVSHDGPGKANIDHEFCPEDNSHFVLHDSQGFEPGETANFDIVMNFIERRQRKPQLKDRLHAIWVCSTMPLAGDRITETGVEAILSKIRGKVPLIIVFTKYDVPITSFIADASDELIEREGDEMWTYGEKAADKEFKEKLYNSPLAKFIDEVPTVKVSTQPRYESTIAKLIEETDKAVQKQLHSSSHIEPTSLAWAVAQRANIDVNIQASIDIGRKRYWSGLRASTDFTGRELRHCLDVIHGDIISVWNLLDRGNYLTSENFKARISQLVQELIMDPNIQLRQDPVTSPSAPSAMTITTVTALAAAVASPLSVAITAIGSAIIFGKWVFEVYRRTPSHIACIMGYIVDLTIVMQRLSTAEVSEEQVVLVLTTYVQSNLAQVHNDIRKFVNTARFVGQDIVVEEIARLIKQYGVKSH